MQSAVVSSCRNLQHVAKNKLVPNLRCITTSATLRDSFTVQDPKDFDEKVKKSKVPVIVDFFATWCAPCRALAPRLESIIADNEGKVNLAKVDIDENTELALDYQVSSIPVLVAIRNGKVEQRLEGLQDADKLRKWIDRVLEQEAKEEEAATKSTN